MAGLVPKFLSEGKEETDARGGGQGLLPEVFLLLLGRMFEAASVTNVKKDSREKNVKEKKLEAIL